MSPGAIPYWAMLVAAILAGLRAINRYEFYRFEEPTSRQYCRPNVDEGERRLGRELALEGHSAIQTFDVIRFRTGRSAVETTSRVIALPGQKVRLDNGLVFVDGAQLNDVYAQRGGRDDWLPEITVPADCVFVLNDQREPASAARDSRGLGPIPLSAVSYRFAPRLASGGN